MAINYASKYANKIDERFSLGSVTTPAVNDDYKFIGVKTVNVYSVPTAPMNDYSRSGTSRYGTPEELGNTVQELTLSRDRSFTFTIDRGNYNDTQMANAAGASLQRQINEVIIPEVDEYRLSKMVAEAGKVATLAVTKENAYDVFLDGTVELTNQKAPTAGRIAFVSASYYKLVKLDNNFVKQGDLAQKTVMQGKIGEIDGVSIIMIPDSYLPENVAFIMTHRVATCAPVKLTEYKIHDNPPGVNGWLVEGRTAYDAFVLENKAAAIYVHKTA